MSDTDASDVHTGTASPFGSAKKGIVLGVVAGIALTVFQILTEPSSIVTAVGGVLILTMIGAVVGLVGSLPLTICYNLVVVALGDGKSSSTSAG
ncbi:MAG: hypothetical protein ABEH78_03580 [Haloferacaceae archaeon]